MNSVCDPAPPVALPYTACVPCEGDLIPCGVDIPVRGFIDNTSCTAGMNLVLADDGVLEAVHGRGNALVPSVFSFRDCVLNPDDGTYHGSLFFRLGSEPSESATKLYWWVLAEADHVAHIGIEVPVTTLHNGDQFVAWATAPWPAPQYTTCDNLPLAIYNSGEFSVTAAALQVSFVVTVANADTQLFYGDVIVGYRAVTEGVGQLGPTAAVQAQIAPINFRVAGVLTPTVLT
jgi:hypothetical protein